MCYIPVFDPRGIRQMDMRACPLDELLAGINNRCKALKYKDYSGFVQFHRVESCIEEFPNCTIKIIDAANGE